MHIAQSSETAVDQETLVNLASARKRWNRETARAVIAAWRESGETARAFCSSRGFPVKRLENWVTRLRREERESQEPPATVEAVFAPVQVVDDAARVEPAQAEVGNDQGRIEVILPSGVRLSLPSDFRTESVRRLAEVFGC